MSDTDRDDLFVQDERPDHMEEECGVFGVYAAGEDVARITYFGLHALQHRGQESAGIAVADGHTLMVVKNLGLVAQVFSEGDLDSLQGHLAVGHTRYSTTGASRKWENAQPMISAIGPNTIALAHNGNLVNAASLREQLFALGVRFRSTTDSEVMVRLVDHFTQQHDSIRGGIRDAILVKRYDLLFGVLGLLVGATVVNLLFGQYNLGFVDQPIAHNDALGSFAAMTIATFAAILLGGCPFRQVIMSSEGDADSTTAVAGMLVGAGFMHWAGLASTPKGLAPNAWPAMAVMAVVVLAIAVYGSRKTA